MPMVGLFVAARCLPESEDGADARTIPLTVLGTINKRQTFLNNSDREIFRAFATLFVMASVMFFSPRSTAPM
jgi:hypothetical protein